MNNEIAKRNEEARALEAKWQSTVNELDKKHYEELNHAQTEINRLKHNISTGNKRLRVAINQASVCTRQNTQTTSVDNAKAYADIDRGTAQRLIGITERGDKAIRQLNALQDYVESIHKE
ncbi:lysis system i-spanin subunit Rz [Pelistega ratti]|uniref:lysis system i-spanin subunit Rz n=1 Tax=Pelistega ratti TaxID=2652177 RepID=UPI00135B34CE|nr:lysis system i-spanin subunit Rz [Pelistega ratti]